MISPVEVWSKELMGLAPEAGPGQLRDEQIRHAMATAEYALAHSVFYRQAWGGRLPEDFFSLPALAPRDFSALWCQPQSRIARIVTLNTSGSTGSPKRVAFSQVDLERTLRFFRRGPGAAVFPRGAGLVPAARNRAPRRGGSDPPGAFRPGGDLRPQGQP